MVEYIKTTKGYYYKVLKNGQKTRISKEDYNKKTKKIGGTGEPIQESDVIYKDELVCILRPEVKKGILIWSHYTQPSGMDSLCKIGLKTGKQLQQEGVYFGRTKIHPYIFFRAPYYSREINYSTPETEIESLYGKELVGVSSTVFIRVDPDRTFVFSSEIRDIFRHRVWEEMVDNIILKSKKTLTNYLKIIGDNALIEENIDSGKSIWYNLFSSKAILFPMSVSPREPFDNYPINRNSEVLVSIPHLTPEYFVSCSV